MNRRRMVISRRIAEMGLDPYAPVRLPGDPEIRDGDEVGDAVRRAVAALDEEEQAFVRQFFMEGSGCADIALASNRATSRIEALRKRVVRRLQARLASFVSVRYGLPVAGSGNCRICCHPRRKEIDHLIASKRPDQTWRPILRQLRVVFGVDLRAPQHLIGHQKYHGCASERPDDQNG